MVTGTRQVKLALLQRIVSLVLIVGVFAIAGNYLANNIDDVQAVLNLSPPLLVALFVLDILFITLNGFRIKVLTEIFDVRLRRLEWLGLSATNSLLNYLPAQGGMVSRGAYLRQVHSLPWPAFLASIAGSYVITFQSLGLVGLVASLAIYFSQGIISLELTGFFVALILGGLLMLSVRWPSRLKGGGPIVGRLERIWQGWQMIRHHNRTVAKLVLLDLLGALVYAIRIMLSFQAVSITVSVWMALALAPPALLSSMISLTPGALGIKEAAVGWGTALLGADMVRGIQAATIDRVIMMGCLVVLSVLFSVRLPVLLQGVQEHKG